MSKKNVPVCGYAIPKQLFHKEQLAAVCWEVSKGQLEAFVLVE